MAEYLKMKHFVVSVPLKDKDLMDKNAIENFTKTYKNMSPLVEFLNHVE